MIFEEQDTPNRYDCYNKLKEDDENIDESMLNILTEEKCHLPKTVIG